MKRTLLITILLLCSFAIGFAAVIADLSGNWSGTLNAPTGDQYPLKYVFKVDGSKLTGSLEVSGTAVPIDSGKVSGNDCSFSVTVEGRAYPQKCKYYAAGDSVGLDVDFGGAIAHTKLLRTP